MITVKICGLMNWDDIRLCVQAGIHSLGFVVDYPQSVPWNLERTIAAQLIRQVPSQVKSVVVTGGTVEDVVATALATRPDIIQLHYHETLVEVEELAGRLDEIGIKTIKALRIDEAGKCAFEISQPAAAARALNKTLLSGLLVDAYSSATPGGSGLTVDLSAFAAVQKASRFPVILAGGLRPDNVGAIINSAKPSGIDVLSGVEHRPGRKDPLKVRRLVQAVAACCTKTSNTIIDET